jgi:anaerobic selenocysteine-containing dehydrogenase
VVLPNAHWLERYDPIANPPFKFEGVGNHDWYWFFRRPVIDPPSPDIQHWFEVLMEIARRAGFFKEFCEVFNAFNRLADDLRLDPEKDQTYLDLCDAVMQDRYGVSAAWYEKNETNVCVQKKSVDEAFPGPFVPGRYNIYMEYWKRAGEEVKKVTEEMGIADIWETDDYQPLLEWRPCPSYEHRDGYDLFAVNYKVACHTFSHTTHNPLLLELGHTYRWIYGVTINRDTAAAKGIEDGEEIWIESEYGYRVKGNAVVTEAVHPEVLGLSGVFGRLVFGEKVGRKVGVHWNTLVGQNLENIDKLSSSLDGCVKVKVYKAREKR